MPDEKSLKTVVSAMKTILKTEEHKGLNRAIRKQWGILNSVKKDEIMTEADIQGYCREKGLKGYKVPFRVEFYEELPRHIDGKIIKRDLEEKYWEGYKQHG